MKPRGLSKIIVKIRTNTGFGIWVFSLPCSAPFLSHPLSPALTPGLPGLLPSSSLEARGNLIPPGPGHGKGNLVGRGHGLQVWGAPGAHLQLLDGQLFWGSRSHPYRCCSMGVPPASPAAGHGDLPETEEGPGPQIHPPVSAEPKTQEELRHRKLAECCLEAGSVVLWVVTLRW